MAVMEDRPLADPVRMLIRHQWVREHGMPRITTLAGSPDQASAIWLEWVTLSGRTEAAVLHRQPRGSAADWLSSVVAGVAALAEAAPTRPIAIACSAEMVDRWVRSRADRMTTFIQEGIVRVGFATTATSSTDVAAGVAARPTEVAAPGRYRSLAELTLFEALQATPSTAGQFQLNQHVSFRFGSTSAEIDLLSRADDLAIEIDGYHHFTDADNYRRDRRKDALLQAHGYAILRLLAQDVLADPRHAVVQVCELLGHLRRRRHRG